jgi:hypothetical protein
MPMIGAVVRRTLSTHIANPLVVLEKTIFVHLPARLLLPAEKRMVLLVERTWNELPCAE